MQLTKIPGLSLSKLNSKIHKLHYALSLTGKIIVSDITL